MYHRTISLLLACCSALSLALSDPVQAFEWEILRLDEREGFMHSPSLAVAPDGRVYVSYVYATNPPSTDGEVYVAIHDGDTWSRTLVSDSYSNYGTMLAISPATGLPGVVFQGRSAGGGTELEFWEYDGVVWTRQDVPFAPIQITPTLAYNIAGEAYLGYSLKTTLAGQEIFVARLAMRTVSGWEDVPIPVQGDWLNLATFGDQIVAVGSSITRGLPGKRWLDAMTLLPNDLAAETVDALSSEVVGGVISARVPGVAIDESGDVLLAYCAAYSTDIEDFAELRLTRFHGGSWNSPEVIVGGGSVSDPAAYNLGLLFRQYVALTLTENRLPFVFGVGEDYGSVNVAYLQAGNWTVETIEACASCGGIWRGRSAGIDPETGTPIIAFTKGSEFAVDTILHVARVIPATGDADGNEIVDLTDYGSLAGCANGPNVLPNASPSIDECLNTFDFDLDGDVDLQDLGVFETLFSQP